MSFNYTFFGKVFPERADVNIFPIELAINNEQAKITGTLKVSIIVSQISALFISEYKIDEIYTLKNLIEDAIRLEIDILGYLVGCGYDIEITSMVDFDFNNIVFGVGVYDLEIQQDKRPKEFVDILKLFSDYRDDYLRRCFSDLREAIRNAKDSGFFCYRAIESLRQYFINEKGCSSDADSWELFRNNLKVERSKIDYIKSFADPVRHGGSIYISGEERGKVLTITSEIIDNYILYASNGYKAL